MPRPIILRQSPIHGKGLFATRPLRPGQRLIEYRGKRVTHDEADCGDSHGVDSGHTFLFTLNERYVIDGSRGGNEARWINHSCDPNCEAVLVEDDGGAKDRVYIETMREIAPGEELSYDYGIVLEGVRYTERMKKLWACHCGTSACTGTLLRPKRGR